MHTLRLSAAALFLALGVWGLATAPAAAQSQVCPDNLRSYSALMPGEPFRCTCRPTQFRGSVWGDGRYTTDSSVCRAAQHAGMVGPAGGPVTLYKASGCPMFVGSARNGVTSRRWGPYATTFTFLSPAPPCATQRVGTPAAACPRSLASYRSLAPGRTLRCHCGPTQYGGAIWGSSRYTVDSSVCGAALHAGAIPATGGVVTVTTAPGCRRFFGSSRNGITTRRWGPYNRTFFFGPQMPPCR
jgi:hypothetical protein